MFAKVDKGFEKLVWAPVVPGGPKTYGTFNSQAFCALLNSAPPSLPFCAVCALLWLALLAVAFCAIDRL